MLTAGTSFSSRVSVTSIYFPSLINNFFLSRNINRVNLSAEIWAVVGVAAGVVIIIVAFIWIIFCVMLYRHQKEREDDEDHEVSEKRCCFFLI